MPISLIFNNNRTGNKDKYIIFREKNTHNLSALNDDLGKINWAELPGLDDPFLASIKSLLKSMLRYDRFFHLKKIAKRSNLLALVYYRPC